MVGEGKPKVSKRGCRQWRTLDWLPDFSISEDGEVVRIRDSLTRKVGSRPGINKSAEGYCRVKVKTPTGKRVLSIHRLVCEAFHGPPPSKKHQCAHNDGDPSNNHFTNLRWATCRENLADRNRHGTAPKGEQNPRAILTAEDVRQIRAEFCGRYGQIAALARQYGLSHSGMLSVCKGSNWNG